MDWRSSAPEPSPSEAPAPVVTAAPSEPENPVNSEVTAKRNVRFMAFTLVSAEGMDFENSRSRQLRFLSEQGFKFAFFILLCYDYLREEG